MYVYINVSDGFDGLEIICVMPYVIGFMNRKWQRLILFKESLIFYFL